MWERNAAVPVGAGPISIRMFGHVITDNRGNIFRKRTWQRFYADAFPSRHAGYASGDGDCVVWRGLRFCRCLILAVSEKQKLR